MQDEIRFWGRKQHYYEFSNFYRAPITLDGKEWPTTEHYYQAHKFLSEELQEHIRNQKSAWDAAQEGRRTDLPLRGDWEEVKEDVMRKAIHAKFTQHNNLREILVNTGNRKIVEASPKDPYWGWGKDMKGKNRLGVLLMELREDISHYVWI